MNSAIKQPFAKYKIFLPQLTWAADCGYKLLFSFSTYNSQQTTNSIAINSKKLV